MVAMGHQPADCWFEPSTEPWTGGWVEVRGVLRLGSLSVGVTRLKATPSLEDMPTITLLARFDDREMWKRLHGETYWRGVYPDDVFTMVKLDEPSAARLAVIPIFDRVRIRFMVEVGDLVFRRSSIIGIRTGFLWNLDYGLPRYVIELGSLTAQAARGYLCGGDPVAAVRRGLEVLRELNMFYPAKCPGYVDEAINAFTETFRLLINGF